MCCMCTLRLWLVYSRTTPGEVHWGHDVPHAIPLAPCTWSTGIAPPPQIKYRTQMEHWGARRSRQSWQCQCRHTSPRSPHWHSHMVSKEHSYQRTHRMGVYSAIPEDRQPPIQKYLLIEFCVDPMCTYVWMSTGKRTANPSLSKIKVECRPWAKNT